MLKFIRFAHILSITLSRHQLVKIGLRNINTRKNTHKQVLTTSVYLGKLQVRSRYMCLEPWPTFCFYIKDL